MSKDNDKLEIGLFVRAATQRYGVFTGTIQNVSDKKITGEYYYAIKPLSLPDYRIIWVKGDCLEVLPKQLKLGGF